MLICTEGVRDQLLTHRSTPRSQSAGTFWVGGSLFTTFIVAPALLAAGDDGQRFFSYLIRNGRLTQTLAAAAGLTVLAGAALYWIDSAGLTSSWMRSGPGLDFGVGAVFAFIGFGLAAEVNRIARRIATIVAALSRRPTQAQILELETSNRRMNALSILRDLMLLIALACMATARYWNPEPRGTYSRHSPASSTHVRYNVAV